MTAEVITFPWWTRSGEVVVTPTGPGRYCVDFVSAEFDAVDMLQGGLDELEAVLAAVAWSRKLERPVTLAPAQWQLWASVTDGGAA